MKLPIIMLLSAICFGSLTAASEVDGKFTQPLRLTLTYGELPDPNYLLAIFKNQSNSNIRILKPVGGSEWPETIGAGLVEPIYELSVRKAAGEALPTKGHCKVFGPFLGTRWPDDYMVMLSPGESIAVKVYIAPNVSEESEYSVQLRYRFTGEIKNPIPAMKESLTARGIWKGEVKSEPKKIRLKKTTRSDLGTRSVEQVATKKP